MSGLVKTTEAAKGKWYGILRQLGMEDRHLQNKHTDCPLCQGGKDRYRWDDKDGSGSYFCNGCGSGTGMDLAMKWTGKEFKEMAKEIDQMVGNIKAEEKKPKANPMKRISKVLSECVELSDNDPVTKYLRFRGLPKAAMLRLHPSLTYFDDGKIHGSHPAMIAPVHSPDGKLVTIHVTYLTADGGKANVPGSVKKLFSSPGDSAAIRLTRAYEHMGIAEGIETALAVMKLYKIPCWACTNARLMEKFIPPAITKKLTIFADNDHSFTGQKSAYVLANKLYEKCAVEVCFPDRIGTDFADEIKKVRAA